MPEAGSSMLGNPSSAWSADGPLRRAASPDVPELAWAFVVALETRDPITANHSDRCASYAVLTGAEMGLADEELGSIRLAALLHDVGKLAVPESILGKPAALSPDEWQVMRKHPEIGEQMLAPFDRLSSILPAIRHHHEHFDGSGYPDGLAGAVIPRGARIVLVCDAFDAMTTDRPYRARRSVDYAVAELVCHAGTQFDPAVVDAFLRVVDRPGGIEVTRRPPITG